MLTSVWLVHIIAMVCSQLAGYKKMKGIKYHAKNKE